MNIEEILNAFHQTQHIYNATIESLQNDNQFRKDLVDYFRQNQDRQFALALLNKLIAIRKLPDGGMPAEDLMLACYVLAHHNDVQDSLKIWEAKDIDFDTHCGIDVQLIVFAGVDATIRFLQQQPDPVAQRALAYIEQCNEGGDFDEINEYFSIENYPWFV